MMTRSFTTIRKPVHCAARYRHEARSISFLLLFRKIAHGVFKSCHRCSAGPFCITLLAVAATWQCQNMSSVQYRSYRQVSHLSWHAATQKLLKWISEWSSDHGNSIYPTTWWISADLQEQCVKKLTSTEKKKSLDWSSKLLDCCTCCIEINCTHVPL